MKTSQGQNDLPRQAGVSIPLAASHALWTGLSKAAALTRGVPKIVLLRPEEEMVETDAGRRVAVMTDKEITGRPSSGVQEPCHSVCSKGASSDAELSIPFVTESCSPQVAPSSEIDLRPESFG